MKYVKVEEVHIPIPATSEWDSEPSIVVQYIIKYKKHWWNFYKYIEDYDFHSPRLYPSEGAARADLDWYEQHNLL